MFHQTAAALRTAEPGPFDFAQGRLGPGPTQAMLAEQFLHFFFSDYLHSQLFRLV
jgi:hypothetical protein